MLLVSIVSESNKNSRPGYPECRSNRYSGPAEPIWNPTSRLAGNRLSSNGEAPAHAVSTVGDGTVGSWL